MENGKQGSKSNQVRSVDNMNNNGLKFTGNDHTRSTKIDKNSSKISTGNITNHGAGTGIKQPSQTKRASGYDQKTMGMATSYSEYQRMATQSNSGISMRNKTDKHSSSSHTLYGGTTVLGSKTQMTSTIGKQKNSKDTGSKEGSSPIGKGPVDRELKETTSPIITNMSPNSTLKSGAGKTIQTQAAIPHSSSKKVLVSGGYGVSPIKTAGGKGTKKESQPLKMSMGEKPLSNNQDYGEDEETTYESGGDSVSINVYGLMNGPAGKEMKFPNGMQTKK